MSSIKGSQEMTEDELGALLDGALDDFCKMSVTEPKETNASAIQNKSNESTNAKKQSSTQQPTVTKESGNIGFNQFSGDIDSPYKLFESDPELKECWSKIVKSCNEPVDGCDNQFRDSLHETLKTISEKAKEIVGDENSLSEDEIARTLTNLAELNGGDFGSGGNEGGEGTFELNKIMPLMSNIMENLLSKDFLYPTLSDLKEKYPGYLKENKDKIPNDDYVRYEKQFKIIVKICEEFDNENDDRNDEEKHARFNRILALMQNMQSYGTPPPTLVSPTSLNTETHPMNDLNMFNNMDPSKCTVM